MNQYPTLQNQTVVTKDNEEVTTNELEIINGSVGKDMNTSQTRIKKSTLTITSYIKVVQLIAILNPAKEQPQNSMKLVIIFEEIETLYHKGQQRYRKIIIVKNHTHGKQNIILETTRIYQPAST